MLTGLSNDVYAALSPAEPEMELPWQMTGRAAEEALIICLASALPDGSAGSKLHRIANVISLVSSPCTASHLCR